jgi:transitional endoplasmic reticulum ATPase
MIYVPPPIAGERLEILTIYTKNVPLGEDVDLKRIAAEAEGFIGADLENLCREAAIFAIREKSAKVRPAHFQQAMKKIHPTVTPEIVRKYEAFVDSLRRQWPVQPESVM